MSFTWSASYGQSGREGEMKNKSYKCSTGHGTGMFMPAGVREQLVPFPRLRHLPRRPLVPGAFGNDLRKGQRPYGKR